MKNNEIINSKKIKKSIIFEEERDNKRMKKFWDRPLKTPKSKGIDVINCKIAIKILFERCLSDLIVLYINKDKKEI